MYLRTVIVRFLRYNLWANERLTSWLLTLDRKILYRETGSSFGTIDRTIQHMLDAERYWHDLLVNGRMNAFNQPPKDNAVETVINELTTSSQRLIDDLAILPDEQLTEIVQAADSAQSRYEYILHVVNHASYHRGQVVTLCRALGVSGEIPTTDYDAYLWWMENMG